jgi:hypothetical protein
LEIILKRWGEDFMERGGYDRRCIDGSVHGCGVCRGYCTFHSHPGYLTEKHMAAHQCVEKGCHYFIGKPKREKVSKAADRSAEIMLAAQKTTTHMEGLRVLRTEQTSHDKWTVYYIAIADYFLEEIERTLSLKCEETICFEKLPYSFDNAVRIILGKDTGGSGI